MASTWPSKRLLSEKNISRVFKKKYKNTSVLIAIFRNNQNTSHLFRQNTANFSKQIKAGSVSYVEKTQR